MEWKEKAFKVKNDKMESLELSANDSGNDVDGNHIYGKALLQKICAKMKDT